MNRLHKQKGVVLKPEELQIMMKDTKNIAARKLKKHSKIGDQTAQTLKTNKDTVRVKNEKNAREKQKEKELNRLSKAKDNTGAKHLFSNEVGANVLPKIPQTRGGRVIRKPERYSPSNEEKRQKETVSTAKIEAEARKADKWLTKLTRNHDKTNSILQSVRKTLPSIFGSS